MKQPKGFWSNMAQEFTALSERYGEIRTEKRDGVWVVIGHPAAVQEFSDLAVIAAEALGFHGTFDQAVGYWCNMLDGHKHRERAGGTKE